MKNLKNLKYLNIEKCLLITDEGLSPIYKYGQKLIVLELGGKYKVSNETIKK